MSSRVAAAAETLKSIVGYLLICFYFDLISC